MFNCVFLSALLYVLPPSGVINHVCMYVYNTAVMAHLIYYRSYCFRNLPVWVTDVKI